MISIYDISLCRIKTIYNMALTIKAIPTLYGKEARRIRLKAEDAERDYMERPQRDITQDSRYIQMRKILQKAGIK